MIDFAAINAGAPFLGAPMPAALVRGCPDGQCVSLLPTGAPLQGTGLPIAGLPIAGLAVAGLGVAVRRRDLTVDTTGVTTPPAYRTDLIDQHVTGFAVVGAPGERTTPGDLPPEDPPS